MIKILVADDHAIIRQGFKQIVSDHADLEVTGEAENAQRTLGLVMKQDFDVVVLDINMPGRRGLDVLKAIKQERPKLPVLILSVHSEDQYAVRALKAGAAGYITKESASEELVKAIRKVCRGGRYVSPSLAEKLAFDLAGETEKPLHENLSDREFQIMLLLASGKSVGEIADELSLSAKTISTYRTRVMGKMRMKKNAELTFYAMQNNLLE